MSNEEVFQTMRDLVAEQFAQEPDEVTMTDRKRRIRLMTRRKYLGTGQVEDR